LLANDAALITLLTGASDKITATPDDYGFQARETLERHACCLPKVERVGYTIPESFRG
jgi:hypothetical protein